VNSLDATLAHPRIARLAAALARRAGSRIPPDAVSRHAAVALIVRLDDDGGDVELLMIRRALYDGDPWSGHIACPGGRREEGDPSLEHTAIRETWEETGVDLDRDGRLLGTLDEVHPRTPRLPPLIIRPYVFAVGGELTVTPSPEVAEAFWVPLPLLADPSAAGEATFVDRGIERTERGFRLGEHVIWGLTERILRQFIELAVGGQGRGRDDTATPKPSAPGASPGLDLDVETGRADRGE
jgi:8-oxo-dGTP pyrophosphatase MutT (NUDIX family)